MHPVVGVALALIAPRRLEAHSLQVAIDHEKELRPEWAAELPQGRLPDGMLATYSETARMQVAAIRRAIFVGVWQGLISVLVGVAAGIAFDALLGAPPKLAVYVLQVIGVTTILAGTTMKAGQEIETFDRCTLPEQLNEQLLPGLSMIGTTILILGYVWDL
jgi:hypothetical protein